MKIILFLFTLSVNFLYTLQISPKSILGDILKSKFERNPKDLNLRQWLNKLVIDLPNDLIKNKTNGYIEDLTLYNISLESLITSHRTVRNNNSGVIIRVKNAGANIKGKYTFLSSEPKDFMAKIYELNVELPFFLVKNESGLVTDVDTSGFTIDIDNAKIELDIDMAEFFRNLLVEALKLVLKFIKEDMIEAKLVEVMNTKLADAFQFVNNIILYGVDPEELHITIDKKDIADVRNSSILGSVAYLLSNLTGANGPLSLNNIVNIFTFDTGIFHLKDIYDKEIHFEFNLTDGNNNSLGNFEFYLDDLNVSGLNTWRDFNALEPYDSLQLLTFTNLDNLTINVSFSLRIKLDNTSKLVLNESILYEKAQFRTNLQNNTLNAFLQLPLNKTKGKEYSNKECLDINCVVDLADNNGTGINALSFNETFTYLILEVIEGGDLEEDLDDTIDKLTDLFVYNFNQQISLLINALLNSTVINLANNKLNEFLFSQSCSGIPDPEYTEIDMNMTGMGLGLALSLFALFIFFPYILGKACTKNNKDNTNNLISEENDRISNLTDLKNVKDGSIEARYCIQGISIKWMKEFGRTDPYGASLFLDPRIPLFFRISLPLIILLTIALFISSNSGTGASVFVVFNVGRRIQVPSLFDFGLINSVHDMWVAGSYGLSLLVAVFSGIWPYLKLILLLIAFFLPTSILSHKSREKILILLDATGKYSILDSYVMIMMLVAFHFHVNIPVTEQSQAKDGSIVDVFVYAAYGFVTLIVGTLISLFLSHVITHLHRSLDEHPDQNKGEKAECYKPIMSFAKAKCIGDIPFRIFISLIIFITLGLVIAGSIIECFSFYFHGLAGYGLDLLNIPPHREFSIIDLGLSVPDAYESPNDPVIIFTQVIYFLTVLAIPLAFLANIIILWFIPMKRRAQKIFYDIAEILNAWSCIDVFVIAIIASLAEIGQFTKFIVGDKCKDIDPIVETYFKHILDGHNTCFEVQSYLEEGCWLFFGAAISFFISSFFILKVCRNALNERLPEHVKEYLKMKKNNDRISQISNINDFSSRPSVVNDSMNSNLLNNNKNFLSENE